MDKKIEQFRNMATTLQKQIDAKRDPAISGQNLTARRARIAASMAKDAGALEPEDRGPDVEMERDEGRDGVSGEPEGDLLVGGGEGDGLSGLGGHARKMQHEPQPPQGVGTAVGFRRMLAVPT